MNTNCSSHLPFIKVLVNYPNEPIKTDDTKLSLRTPQLDDCKLVKSKSHRTKASEQNEFDEDSSDATVTTECSDGPGCRVPWLMPRKSSSGPQAKFSPTKSLKSKRIAKADKIVAGANHTKRAYKKRVVQGAIVSEEIKSTNQVINAHAL